MRFDAVIFDIDNVLIDTRASYIDCIRKTVERYLEIYFHFQPSRSPLLTRKNIETFKSLGGFNDDWDACYGLLLYLLTLKPKRRTLGNLLKKIDFKTLLKKNLPHPLGVRGAEKLFSRHYETSIPKNISRSNPVPRLLRPSRSTASPRNDNAFPQLQKIQEIFQNLYLKEYVWNERPLISKAVLQKIKGAGIKIGILTGRSREEALFVLRRFQMDQLFDSIITQSDTPRVFRKPHPYGLLANAKRLGKMLQYLYVGDLPDDMLTAKRAKTKMRVTACGFVQASESRDEMKMRLKKAGARYVVKNSQELLRLVFGIQL